MLVNLIPNFSSFHCDPTIETNSTITNDEDIIEEIKSAFKTNKYHRSQLVYLQPSFKSDELRKIYSDKLGSVKTDRDIILNSPTKGFIKKQYVEMKRVQKIEDIGKIKIIFQTFDKPPESLKKLLSEQLSERNQDLLFEIGGARNLPDTDLMYFVIPKGNGILKTYFFLVEVNYKKNTELNE